MTGSSALRAPQGPPPCCNICNEVLGVERLDGMIEHAAILPCSHVFGSICISRVRVSAGGLPGLCLP